jgi:hypothetical protein
MDVDFLTSSSVVVETGSTTPKTSTLQHFVDVSIKNWFRERFSS